MNASSAALAVYRNFDDDALAALASVGLVRRAAKDVEAGRVAWDGEPAAGAPLQVRADGQLVSLGQDGPAKARCDCPAPGVCKHILAAAIWLRGVDEPGTANSDPLAELCALDPAAVFRSAGAAATRKAAALSAGAGPVTLTAQGGVLLIALPELDLVCRYIAGAGFGGMVSEAAPGARTALHLVALTAAWRSCGREFAWPQDAPVAVPAPDALSQADRQLLARLRALLLEVCGGGWSHVSEAMPMQLRALAMSARVEAFPRLAGMVRTLAGTAELLAARDAAADERQAIKLAARIHATCEALEHASGAGLAALRGQDRRKFVEGEGELALLPLGAHWWELRSGARGLTVSFWDSAAGGVAQAVLARRDALDRAFSRETAWSAHALWSGLGPASTLCGTGIALQDVRLSSDNRLGIGGDTRACATPAWRSDDPRWLAAGFDDWQALAQAVRAGAGLRSGGMEVALLKPAAQSAPQLDEVAQLLTWTLGDRHGKPLVLRLPCEQAYHERIGNLEAWTAFGVAIRGVLVRLERALHGGLLEPLSLVVESKGILSCISLDYQVPPASLRMAFANRIMRMLRGRDHVAVWKPPPHPQWVDALLTIMEHKAMTGRLHLIGEERSELAALARFLRAAGLDTVADALARYLAAPGVRGALVLVHLCQTCAELDTDFIFR